jgi:hypothetical protein
MKSLLFFIAATTLLTATAASACASSGGSFSLPGSAVAELRRQVTGPSGRAVAVDRLKFTYNPSSHALITVDGVSRISSTIISPAEDGPVSANPRSFTIGGRVATAIVRGIDERTRAILPSMLQREREGRFTIAGYDHGTSSSSRKSSYRRRIPRSSANPLSLDICTPHVGYLIAVPSYTIQKMDVNYCGLTN